MDWISLLNSSEDASNRDKALFKDWEKGKIGTKEAIRRFKSSNEIPERMIINDYEFEQWLGSLGYRRM